MTCEIQYDVFVNQDLYATLITVRSDVVGKGQDRSGIVRCIFYCLLQVSPIIDLCPCFYEIDLSATLLESIAFTCEDFTTVFPFRKRSIGVLFRITGVPLMVMFLSV